MLLEENQITFHSDNGLIFDGVKDYSRQIAEMIGLGSDSEFLEVGVCIVSLYTIIRLYVCISFLLFHSFSLFYY